MNRNSSRKMGLMLLIALFLGGSLIIPADSRATPQGAVYYVAVNGSDETGDGSIEQPWRTIQKAADIMVAGDTCIIRQGIYREEVTISASGTESRPIRFESYPGEEVTISGTEPVSGWQQQEASIYKAPFVGGPGGSNQIYVNGERMVEAKWPNNGPENHLLAPAMAEVDSGSLTTITDGELQQPDGFWNGAKVTVKGGDGWILQTSQVTQYTLASGLVFASLPNSESTYYTPRPGNKYYLSGILGALDTEKEWHYDPSASMLYLWLQGGAAPNADNVEARVRTYGLRLNGQAHVEFSGIGLFAADIDMGGASHITIDNAQIRHLLQPIHLTGTGNVIKNSTLAYAPEAILNVEGIGNAVTNNLIESGNYNGTWNAIVNMRGSQNYLGYNTIRYAGRGNVGIYGKANLIEYNDIYYGGMLTNDNGLVYGGYTDGVNTVIRYNWLHDNLAEKLAEGLYPDNGSFNYIIHHNVIWNAGTPLRLNTPNNYMLVYNNTLLGNTGMFGHIYKSDMYGGRFANNILVGKYNFSDDVVRLNNIEGSLDPRLANPVSDSPDFRPLADSPAVDAGMAIEGITGLFAGLAPDIGAYEYGGELWKPGHNFQEPPSGEYETVETTYMNRITEGGFERTPVGLEGTDWVKTGAGDAQVVYDYSITTTNKNSRGGNYGLRLGSVPVKEYEAGLIQEAEAGIEAAIAVRNQPGAGPQDRSEAMVELNRHRDELENSVPPLIADSGFEGTAITGWRGESSTIALTGADSYSGNQALWNYNRIAAWAGPRIRVPVRNGKSYNVSAWVKLASTGERVRIVFMPNGVNTPRTVANVQVNDQEWRLVGATYTVNEPADITYAVMALFTQTSTAEMMVDDFVMVEVTELIAEIERVNGLLQTAPEPAKPALHAALAQANGVLANVQSTKEAVAAAIRQLADAASQPELASEQQLSEAIGRMEALVASAVSSEDGIEQTVGGLKPNTRYRLTGWSRTSDPADQVVLGVRDYGGGPLTAANSSTGWSRKELVFTTGPEASSAVVFIHKPLGSQPAYTDDIGLTVYEERLPSGIKSGGLLNSGFETGYAHPWFSFGTELEAGPAWAVEGSYGLRVANRTAPDQGPIQYAEVYDGRVYDVGARVRLGAGTDTVKLMLSFLVNGEVRIREVAAGTAHASEWTELSGQYAVGEGGNIDSAAFYIVTDSSVADLYVDQVVLKEHLVETAPGTGDGISNMNEAVDAPADWVFSKGQAGRTVGDGYITLTDGNMRYTAETYRDALLSFNLRLAGPAGSWPIINLRNQGVEGYNSGYVFVIKQDVIELQRRTGGATVMIFGGDEFSPGIGGPAIANAYLPFGETALVEAGTFNTGSGVRILLRINGEPVIDYEDTLNSIRQAGYFSLYWGTAQEVTISRVLAVPVISLPAEAQEKEAF